MVAAAVSKANAAAAAAQNRSNSTAPAPKAYDPMIVVEAMFNGCVTRIGQTFRDPKEYAEGTKSVLPECTKRFQDALDDCEIQILDAKWYLEQKLAENKAQRDARAKEASAATATAKRKHDELQEKEHAQTADSPAKRAKINDQQSGKDAPKPAHNLATPSDPSKAGRTTPLPSQPQAGRVTPQPLQTGRTTPQPPQPQTKMQSQPMARSASNPPPQANIKQEEKKPPEPTPAQQQPASPPQPELQFNADDFSKPTPQVTPALTNEEFNFESMFGEPPEDNNMDGTNDMFIDLDDAFANFTDNTTANNNSNNQIQSSLNPILSGLEAYANQTDDPANNTSTNTMKNNMGGMGADSGNTFTDDLDLPDLGGPNIFDDMLNDTDFGGEFTGGGDGGGDFTSGGGASMSFDDLIGDA